MRCDSEAVQNLADINYCNCCMCTRSYVMQVLLDTLVVVTRGEYSAEVLPAHPVLGDRFSWSQNRGYGKFRWRFLPLLRAAWERCRRCVLNSLAVIPSLPKSRRLHPPPPFTMTTPHHLITC